MKTTTSTPLYTRELTASGKPRYKLYKSTSQWDNDAMKPGECRLAVCSGDGMRRYQYGVTPDTAGWTAAATLAALAMEKAIMDASHAKPTGVQPYTKTQLAVLEQCRKMMQDCGALLPTHWQHSHPSEIAQAAIDAVRNWKP